MAPAGQRYRHQNRRATSSRTKIAAKSAAESPASSKTIGRKGSRWCFLANGFNQPCVPVVARPVQAGVGPAVEQRVGPDSQSPHQQRERIDQSDQGKGEHGGHQNGEQQDVVARPRSSLRELLAPGYW